MLRSMLGISNFKLFKFLFVKIDNNIDVLHTISGDKPGYTLVQNKSHQYCIKLCTWEQLGSVETVLVTELKDCNHGLEFPPMKWIILTPLPNLQNKKE